GSSLLKQQQAQSFDAGARQTADRDARRGRFRGAASSSESGFAGCSLFCKRARSARHVGAQMLSIDVVVARTDLLRIGSVLSETYYETLVSIGARFWRFGNGC